MSDRGREVVGSRSPGPRWKPAASIIAVAGIALIALIVLVVVPSLGRGAAPSDGGAAEPATPSEYVEGYLRALADGDADAAVEYVSTAVYGDDLLTDEMLAASLERGVIADIEIERAGPQSDYGDVVVSASFSIGGAKVDRDFEVFVDGEEMTIQDGIEGFDSRAFAGMRLSINGFEAPQKVGLFPGTYDFALANPYFVIDGEPTVVLGHPDDGDALLSLRAVISEVGASTYRSLVIASLQECEAMKTLMTPCGDDVADLGKNDPTAVDGTVTREIPLESESKLLAVTVLIDGTVARWESSIGMTTTFESASGSKYLAFGAALKTPKVDFAAETPTVVWE